jgi:hypothetical protein
MGSGLQQSGNTGGLSYGVSPQALDYWQGYPTGIKVSFYMHTVLESIGTANPPFKRSQSEAARFMTQVEGFSAPLRNRIESIYENSGIDHRYSCLEDYGLDPEQFEFYPKNWSLQPFPTTGARNQEPIWWQAYPYRDVLP